MPQSGDTKDVKEDKKIKLNGEIFEKILIDYPSIGKWILDSYITVQRQPKSSSEKRKTSIEFDQVKRYKDEDELVFDLSLDNLNEKSDIHWICKLSHKESEY